MSLALPLAVRMARKWYLTANFSLQRGRRLYEADLGLRIRSCDGGKDLFLPKYWATPISWRLKKMLQNNWWFHQMYRELEAEMSILLDKRSRHTEREWVKYINYRVSERVSGNTDFSENLLYNLKSVCKAFRGNLWLASLATNNCRLTKSKPYGGPASSAHTKTCITPRTQVFDSHPIQR